MQRIIIIDNHDSFTGNIFQLFDELSHCQVEVVSIDALKVEELQEFDRIVISPGPEVPAAYPKLFEVLQLYAPNTPILGICLGLQTLVVHFGGSLYNLAEVYHGRKVGITLDYTMPIFVGLAKKIKVGLYHSWAVDKSTLPDCFNITAESSLGIVMGIAHKKYNCIGLQFHPESYMTKDGEKMIENWMRG